MQGSFQVNPLQMNPLGEQFLIAHVQDNLAVNNELMKIDAVLLWKSEEGKIKEVWDILLMNTWRPS